MTVTIVGGPACCSTLKFFPAGVFSVQCKGSKRGRRAPAGTDQGVIDSLLYLWVFSFSVLFDEA